MIKIIVNVLDDDPVIPDLIKELFSDDKTYDISCFSTANEFFNAFSKKTNLVITDVRVPEYDVISTIETIGKINPSCYIVVMSAYFDVAILKEFIRLRVDAVVEKGPTLDWFNELRSAVESLRPKMIEKARLKL